MIQPAKLVFLAVFAGASLMAHAAEGEDKSRFSDQPAPLDLSTFPERPAPLLEIGDKFLGKGNLQRGFTLPTGAVWSPNLWVFGTFRSAIQTFDRGSSRAISPQPNTTTTEWANRLDIFGNLQLSPTERVVLGFRPLDETRLKTGTRFAGYNIEPNDRTTRGGVEAFSATPRTLFFEGEFGEIFPRLDQADRLSLDYSFAVGRQPLTLQDGILANDDSVDMISITRNSLRVPGGSTMRISPFFAFDRIERPNFTTAANVRDHSAQIFGVDAAADFPVSTIQADLVYVPSSSDGDGLYAGIGAVQRIGKINTTFRANTSIALEKPGPKVGNGTLLFTELSYTVPWGTDLIYLNGFWAIDHFTSAVRDTTAGGPLGRVGILNAAVGLGRYGAPLSNQADNAVGGALGYQMFFGELRRRQVILEIGGRAPTEDPQFARQRAAEGIGVRYQQSFGRRFVLVLDAFGVNRDLVSPSYGGRMELLVKF
ncbi:MAG: hypothetical protein ABIQ35_04985 [Verrucomicrobiota bacterium]